MTAELQTPILASGQPKCNKMLAAVGCADSSRFLQNRIFDGEIMHTSNIFTFSRAYQLFGLIFVISHFRKKENLYDYIFVDYKNKKIYIVGL